MEPSIYFMKESPDFNYFIERGRTGRIAANRVVLCVMTEYGLVSDRRMSASEFSRFIESTQMSTGKEYPRTLIKTIPLGFTSITYPNEMSIECTT